jgi:hypothetical protein
VNAGYPDRQRQVIAFYFDDGEATVKDWLAVTKRPISGYAAFRQEYLDFDDGSGSVTAARRALFNAVNARRASSMLPKMTLPLRAYYDEAQQLSTDVASIPLVPDVPVANPTLPAPVRAGYRAAANRKGKDGIVVKSDDMAINSSSIPTMVAAFTPLQDAAYTSAAQLSIGLSNATAACAIQRQQWLAYGVRYWISEDASIPILSWDGYPSWNWFTGLVSGTQVSGNYVDLNYFTHRVREVAAQIFSKRIYANGRQFGELPAYVISAGVQATDILGKDRVVVLTWQLDDQDTFSLSPPSEYARVLRVFFADIHRRDFFGVTTANGPALSPTDPIIGLYDATTNPSGWHYAGKIEMWVHGGGFGGMQNFLQPPQFSPNGQRAVAVVAAYDPSFLFIGTEIQEVVFGSMGDSSLSFSIGTLSGTSGGHLVVARMAHVDTAATQAISADYRADNSTINVIYYCQSVSVGGVGTPCLRWSGDPSQTGLTSTPHDLLEHNGDAGFSTVMLFVQDPLTGTMFLVDQQQTVPGNPYSFRFRSVRSGSVQSSTTIADPSHQTPFGFVDALGFINDSNFMMPVFAKDRAGSFIAGYQSCPAGPNEGSAFQTNLGDLAAMTHTPGNKLGLYPVGVI